MTFTLKENFFVIKKLFLMIRKCLDFCSRSGHKFVYVSQLSESLCVCRCAKSRKINRAFRPVILGKNCLSSDHSTRFPISPRLSSRERRNQADVCARSDTHIVWRGWKGAALVIPWLVGPDRHKVVGGYGRGSRGIKRAIRCETRRVEM